MTERPRRRRLSRSAEFERVYRQGRSKGNRHFVLYAFPREADSSADGPRLGLSADETETVEWLVRHHLLMSDMAQKRDIGDPRTLRDFAKAVKTVKRLNLLTVLTVCDIRGVGPNTWNNWKAMLLRQLYQQTNDALEAGLETVTRHNREDEAKLALRQRLQDWSPGALAQELSRHYAP